jgi:hypothetical protein
VNCEDLHADRIATLVGLDIDKKGYCLKPCKGNYFALLPAPKLRHLVYPVLHKNKEYFGIHTMPDLAGRVRLSLDIRYLDSNPLLAGSIPYKEFSYAIDEGLKK